MYAFEFLILLRILLWKIFTARRFVYYIHGHVYLYECIPGMKGKHLKRLCIDPNVCVVVFHSMNVCTTVLRYQRFHGSVMWELRYIQQHNIMRDGIIQTYTFKARKWTDNWMLKLWIFPSTPRSTRYRFVDCFMIPSQIWIELWKLSDIALTCIVRLHTQ